MIRATKFKKMGPLAKGIIALVIIGVLTGIGVFCFSFFNRSVQCMEGEFLSPNNQCLSCPQGCIRCEDNAENRCTKCDLDMYLVIDNEQDREGYCKKECAGRVIRAYVCLK
jgi:hypothetical protein